MMTGPGRAIDRAGDARPAGEDDASRYVRFPEAVEPDAAVGGKARALTALTQAGFPVPAWFVVLPAAFADSLSPAIRERLAGARGGAAAQDAIAPLVVAGGVGRALAAALAALCPGGEAVAVRSSALEEDAAAHSFAGQLESFLWVEPGEVPDRVVRVWRSAFSARLMRYRVEAGLSGLPGPPAVIVQRMVPADASGVAFSADPVTGRRRVAVVAAVPGLGSALVSGLAAADSWRVDRDDRIVESHLADKRVAHRRDPTSAEGVRAVPLDPAQASRPALDAARVVAVARLARQAARFFGRPQDIEWGLAGGALFLLQSRPITALAALPDPDAAVAIWDNANIAESYSGVTTPFTFSFARIAYEQVYRQFSRIMRVPEPVIAEHGQVFRCMLGLVRGRVYYNLLNWYRLLALLPGYRLNRLFFEQMIGVHEPLPAHLVPAVPRLAGGRAREWLHVAATLWGLAAAFLTLRGRIRRFRERLASVLGAGQPDLAGLDAHELVEHYHALERRILARWDAPLVNDMAAMIAFGLLRRLARRWAHDTEGRLPNDLLSGEPGMVSLEPARRVAAMATLAAADAGLVAVLCEAPLARVRHELARHPALAAAIEEYLERFGDRCIEELKLESPTLHDDPLPLLRSIGQSARSRAGPRPPDAEDRDLRGGAEAAVHAALARRPLRYAVFRWVLGWARARVRDRENLRFERTRMFARGRRIALELGRRLVSLDVLDEPRDVFYLEVDELLSYVEMRATTTGLRRLVALRRAEFDEFRRTPAPDGRFQTHGVAQVGHDYRGRTARAAPPGETLRGLGCCAGVVRGPVRVVTDPRDARLRPGEILVATRTDPGWVMIFPAARGLLVEEGSLLSHSAIVAREMGLPAIVSLAGLTRWLRDGDVVEMDGATGVVVKLGPGGEPADGAPR
jgi:pyruvate,water dikinase